MNKHISTTDHSRSFLSIADKFLNNTQISIKGKLYRIYEVEFYWLSDIHKDEYTHGFADQAEYGKFYFHKLSNGMSFKGGTFKGMDITLGYNDHFGVLIRAIYDISGNKFIQGPCLTVNEILKETGHEKIINLVESLPNLSCVTHDELKLVDLDIPDTNEIFSGPRIGLSDKHPEWKDAKYRFVIHGTTLPWKQKRSLTQIKTG